MKSGSLLHIVCVLAVFAAVAASPMKPTKRYLAAMENSIKAHDKLLVCRSAAAGEQLKQLTCFLDALQLAPYNATWYKQAAAIYMMSSQRKHAMDFFNKSAYTILDAQAFVNLERNTVAPNLSPITMLKLYGTREGEGSVELAKVWAQSLQLQYRPTIASQMAREFLVNEQDEEEEAVELLRALGDIVESSALMPRVHALYREVEDQMAQKRLGRQKKWKIKAKRPTSMVAVIGEEITSMLEVSAQRWLAMNLTVNELPSAEAIAEAKNDTLAYSRAMCGVGVSFTKTEYTLHQVVQYLSLCVANSGILKKALEEEPEETATEHYAALLKSPLHHAAGWGMEYVTRHLAKAHPQELEEVDNFGRTPMHYAVAHRQLKVAKLLLKLGGPKLLQSKDAGQITPLGMGCLKDRAFRGEFEKMLEGTGSIKNPCGPYTGDDFIQDQDADSEENESDGGGWANARPPMEPSTITDCPLHIRSGDSMGHHELIGRYLHSAEPVVLRGIIPAQILKELQKKPLMKSHGLMTVRQEVFPNSENYGVQGVNANISLQDFFGMKDTVNSKHFVLLDVPKQHRLNKLLDWVPEKLIPKGEGYTSVDNRATPLFVAATTGAHTNHVVRGTHFFFALVHGRQQWALTPPPQARTTQAPTNAFVVQDDTVTKCSIHGGDILVVPAGWSVASRSVGESVGFGRRFSWK